MLEQTLVASCRGKLEEAKESLERSTREDRAYWQQEAKRLEDRLIVLERRRDKKLGLIP